MQAARASGRRERLHLAHLVYVEQVGASTTSFGSLTAGDLRPSSSSCVATASFRRHVERVEASRTWQASMRRDLGDIGGVEVLVRGAGVDPGVHIERVEASGSTATS